MPADTVEVAATQIILEGSIDEHSSVDDDMIVIGEYASDPHTAKRIALIVYLAIPGWTQDTAREQSLVVHSYNWPGASLLGRAW